MKRRRMKSYWIDLGEKSLNLRNEEPCPFSTPSTRRAKDRSGGGSSRGCVGFEQVGEEAKTRKNNN